MRQRVLLYSAFSVILALLATGVLFLSTRQPVGVAVDLLPPPTPLPIKIDISGAVAQPGLYELPAGSRVQDAILAAGGLLPEADTSALNLAAPLEDGTRIYIPSQRPTAPPAAPKSSTVPPDAADPAPTGLINLNTATLEELDSLPGIGPAIAQRIIDYRTANGLFATIENLQNVKGIGPATFEKLKDKITVGP
jgi:competence protein ComEA